MSTFARAKARFEADRFAARHQATENLRGQLGGEFTIAGWSGRAREAFLDQWSKEPGVVFPWDDVFRRHNDPDRLDVAIWGPNDRLCGLGLGLTTSEAVELRFLEGDPRPDCPLKGRRILMFLECAACYAQARGRRELRIQPINEQLETLYRQTYGFVLETPRGGERYYRRGI
jgi:hypothetical protein